MKVEYEIYSSIFEEVTEVARKLTKSLQEFTAGCETLRIGWKIGSVSVEIPDGMAKEHIKNALENAMKATVPKQEIWLKEKEATIGEG